MRDNEVRLKQTFVVFKEFEQKEERVGRLNNSSTYKRKRRVIHSREIVDDCEKVRCFRQDVFRRREILRECRERGFLLFANSNPKSSETKGNPLLQKNSSSLFVAFFSIHKKHSGRRFLLKIKTDGDAVK